ncbi:MAG: Hpt domain-containing protein [Trichlorobacter sp.]|uniref:Hpt domain-containing protein n=1 Tax=Trichlorobacter sp. TaxID=2911007 RepID=UPI00256D8A70|nr:Hpt domain-containing protein [Trichlorobacter sp.]MDK9718400.1 Hpt domain-containing protein [Trichlorobacter sp.]
MEKHPDQTALLDFEYLQINYHDAGFGYLLPEILELFRGQATLYLDLIEDHLRHADLHALALEAHTLKGTAGSVGAAAIEQAALLLENGVADAAITTVAAQVGQLRKIVQQTETAITAELARLASTANEDVHLL